MSTHKTSVEVDEKLLGEAQRVLGTKTIRETIQRALEEVVRAEARREETDALATMKDLDLADPEIMAGAWRP
jgi:Arc/MetJ family transcription regulator